jgi:hypothetical protein
MDAISAFFSHPFVLMVGTSLLGFYLRIKEKQKKEKR